MAEDNQTDRTGLTVHQETKNRLMEDRKTPAEDGGLGFFTETWDEYLNVLLDQAQEAR